MSFASVGVVVSNARFLRWHQRLRDRLARLYPRAGIGLRFDGRGAGWPSGVAPLLALERMLLRRSRPTLSDSLDPSRGDADSACDMVLDLTGGAVLTDAVRVLRPLYDGRESDHYAVAAILAGRAPTLAIEDARTGAIVAQGLPSLEAADGLTGGLEAVYSRVITLIEQALATPTRPLNPWPAARSAPAGHAFVFALRNIGFQCARAIYHLCCYSPHWRVGWRFVDGPGVLEMGALGDAPWKAMEDRELSFAADPFPIDWRGRSGVFYERLDYASGKGLIYFQEFGTDGPVGEPVRALEEPWHLSYPSLIEQDGELYMLPEASASGAVTLYRCVEFPHRWERAATLLDKIEAADATIFAHHGRYYMTSVVRDGVGGYSDTLAIHHAPALFGPWEDHALRPTLVDSRYARPAGALKRHGETLLRPVQDCSEGYGKRLVIMRVDDLSPESFRQTPLATVNPGGVWPGKRLHTLNRCGRLECIDGVILSPRNLALRRAMHRYADSRAATADPATPAIS